MTTAKTPAKTTAPRKPQDRKPKAEEQTAAITVTVDDVTVTLDADSMDDYELMEDVAKIDDGQHYRIGRVLEKLLGADAHSAVKEKFREPDSGKVRMEGIVMFFHEVMKAVQAEVDSRG